MKFITILSILLGLILISSTQCSKEVKETDYRDAFIGDYIFTVNAYHYAADSIFKDSLYYFSGYISKSDYSPSAILIFSQPTFNTVANISNDGKLGKIYGFGIGWNLGGKFEGVDRLWFRFGGLYTCDSVTGIRK